VARTCLALLVAQPLVAQSALSDTSVAHRLRPQFAGGTVWIMSLPMSPREIASRLTGKSPGELLDSTVTAMTMQYLEAMDAERAARGEGRMPSWTTEIGGQTVGLDSRYVYLGPLKVPTFLIALLPIKFPGINPTEWDRQRTLDLMRYDIRTAGARQANLAEFGEAVKQLRAEREARREFEANQRRPPPEDEDPT